jgi:indole-3-glycerol phosphate synthase
VAGLSDNQLNEFAALTKELGMRALVEVHTHQELERALAIDPELVGINSRNLKTLEVDAKAFAELLPEIPTGLVRVAESGISNRSDVEFAQKHGANAILVGEALVKAGDPILAMRDLLGQR